MNIEAQVRRLLGETVGPYDWENVPADEDLRREMREHTAAIPAARHMFGLNASERGAKGGDQSTGRLPHIGSHHKSQGSDSTATNDGDTTALGKHSKGGEA